MGSVEDVYGTISAYGFVVELNDDIKADSFKSGDIIYGDPFNMLPLDRFIESDKKGAKKSKPLHQQGEYTLRLCPLRINYCSWHTLDNLYSHVYCRISSV